MHVDPEALRRFPILGVLLGCVTAVFVVLLLNAGIPEARQLLAQSRPDSVSVHEAVTLSGTRWVVLPRGEWHCEQALSIPRRPGLERWLLGPIETTEIPLTGAESGEILVARFDGAVSCEARAGSVLSGVVGSTEIFTSLGTTGRWSRGGARVAVLNVGASPRQVLMFAAGLLGVVGVGIGLAVYYLRQMLLQRRRREAPVSGFGPIQPS